MDYKVFIPVLISFVLSVILGPLVIPVLRRLKMDQTERTVYSLILRRRELRQWEE